MNERMKFVTRLQNGERMTDLCNEFGISRKTGYKLLTRFRLDGPRGLYDESRRPHENPRSTPLYIEDLILELKDKRPTWGAKKLRAFLEKNYLGHCFPCQNTFHNILLKHDLVKRQKHARKYKAQGTEQRETLAPNDLWCIDFKGDY